MAHLGGDVNIPGGIVLRHSLPNLDDAVPLHCGEFVSTFNVVGRAGDGGSSRQSKVVLDPSGIIHNLSIKVKVDFLYKQRDGQMVSGAMTVGAALLGGGGGEGTGTQHTRISRDHHRHAHKVRILTLVAEGLEWRVKASMGEGLD